MRPEDTLAAEHALGLTDETARDEAESRLATDPAFAAEVAAWRDRFGELDDTAQPQQAGDDLWERIEAALPLEAPRRLVAPSQVQERSSGTWPPWESPAFWRAAALAAAATALILAVLLGASLLFRETPRPQLVAVLLTADRSEPGAIVQAFADGRVVLTPLDAIAVPQDRALQIWTVPGPGRDPVPAGLLREARSARLSLDAAPQPAQAFEITLEPAGGSPTGRPSGPVLMKGVTNRAY